MSHEKCLEKYQEMHKKCPNHRCKRLGQARAPVHLARGLGPPTACPCLGLGHVPARSFAWAGPCSRAPMHLCFACPHARLCTSSTYALPEHSPLGRACGSGLDPARWASLAIIFFWVITSINKQLVLSKYSQHDQLCYLVQSFPSYSALQSVVDCGWLLECILVGELVNILASSQVFNSSRDQVITITVALHFLVQSIAKQFTQLCHFEAKRVVIPLVLRMKWFSLSSGY